MLDTHESVINFLEAVLDQVDYAHEYGEPGYSLPDGETAMIVFASYWCRCGTPDDLHGVETHYPHAFQRLEDNGVVMEWYDEWVVDHETDKAYRTSGDHYGWKPSLIVTDLGDYLTPDDDLETWLEYMVNDHGRAIPGHIYGGKDLAEIGFDQFNGRFEHGWYPGQDADPELINVEINRQYGDVDVVFVLESTGQFDLDFTAWWRAVDRE